MDGGLLGVGMEGVQDELVDGLVGLRGRIVVPRGSSQGEFAAAGRVDDAGDELTQPRGVHLPQDTLVDTVFDDLGDTPIDSSSVTARRVRGSKSSA